MTLSLSFLRLKIVLSHFFKTVAFQLQQPSLEKNGKAPL